MALTSGRRTSVSTGCPGAWRNRLTGRAAGVQTSASASSLAVASLVGASIYVPSRPCSVLIDFRAVPRSVSDGDSPNACL